MAIPTGRVYNSTADDAAIAGATAQGVAASSAGGRADSAADRVAEHEDASFLHAQSTGPFVDPLDGLTYPRGAKGERILAETARTGAETARTGAEDAASDSAGSAAEALASAETADAAALAVGGRLASSYDDAETRAAAWTAGDLVVVAADETRAGTPDRVLYRVANPAAAHGSRLTYETDALGVPGAYARGVTVSTAPTAEQAIASRTGLVVSGGITQVAWRDIAQGLNAEWSVDGLAGVTRAEADGGETEWARGDANVAALNRALLLGAAKDVPVYLPTERAAGADIFFPFRGQVLLSEGSELVGGRLRIPDGALSSATYNRNAVRCASGITEASLRGVVIDGGAAGNLTEYVIGRMIGSARIRGLFEGIDLSADPYVNEGPASVPPQRLRLNNVTVRNVLGSCIVSARTQVIADGLTLENSYSDHLVYDGDAQQGLPGGAAPRARSRYSNVVMRGFWRGSALDVSGTDVDGLVVTDVVANPNAVNNEITADLHKLGAVLGMRAYRGPCHVTGVRIAMDLALVDDVMQAGHAAHYVEAEIAHEGAADLPEGQTVTLVGPHGADAYYGRPRGEARMDLTVYRAPGGTVVYSSRNSLHERPPRGSVRVDWHPEARRTDPYVADLLGARRAPLDLDVYARQGVSGAQFAGLVNLHKGTYAGIAYADITIGGDVHVGTAGLVRDVHLGEGVNSLTRLNLRGIVRQQLHSTHHAGGITVLPGARVLGSYATPRAETGTWSLTYGGNPNSASVTIPHALGVIPDYVRVLRDGGMAGSNHGRSVTSTAVVLTLDPTSLVGVASGTVITGTYRVETYGDLHTDADEEIALTTVSGLLTYELPIRRLLAVPAWYRVHRLDTGAEVAVVASGDAAPTTTTLTVTFASDPAGAVIPLRVQASVAAQTRALAPSANIAGALSVAATWAQPSDASVEYDVTLPSAGNLDVRLRIVDSSNYLRFRMVAGGQITLSTVVAGTSSAVGTLAAGLLSTGQRLKIRLEGSSIRFYVNGAPVGTTLTTSVHVTASGGGRFNNAGTGGGVANLRAWPVG